MLLKDKIALVTGASRGIGRGIALQLGAAHATVYITGRKPSQNTKPSFDLPSLEDTAREINKRGGTAVVVYCDHSKPDEIEQLFKQIEHDHNGRLDILVNNAYSAVQTLMQVGGKKFWQLDPLIWDDVNNVGLRNHYICSVYASRLMVAQKRGLIVNISSAGGLRYFLNVAYGTGKAALDRMTVDCAEELKEHSVACVSLWPGAVKTEMVHELQADETCTSNTVKLMAKMCENGESPEYAGKCVVHLATDVNLMTHTGRILLTSDLGDHYGFTDINGAKPRNIRSVKALLEWSDYKKVASYVPAWLKLPSWILTLSGSKF